MAISQLAEHGIPIKTACKRLEMPRASFYRETRGKDSSLLSKIKEFALRFPAYGYRKITELLRREGMKVNHKRVYRLYKLAGLQKPSFRSKRKRMRERVSFSPTPALYPGHIFAIDFIHDRTESGKMLRIFNIIDIFSRRAFEAEVGYSLPGERISSHLEKIFLEFGAPKIIRRDDGSEFRSKEFQTLLSKWRIKDEVIPAGQPFDNGYIESFHGRMRDEVLKMEVFPDAETAKERILKWIEEYNRLRPHSMLGNKTPMEVWNGKKG